MSGKNQVQKIKGYKFLDYFIFFSLAQENDDSLILLTNSLSPGNVYF